MVNCSPETGKRDADVLEIEPETEESLESKMKKPRVEEDTETMESEQVNGRLSANDELKVRIKKYLEENKSLKYIDVERMSQNLHLNYPDYRRRKLKVFKNQVDFAFKSLTEEMVSKRKSNSKKKKKDNETNNQCIEEIRIEDETTVKGSSMNSRLSTLYSESKASGGSEEDCEVIEDDVDDILPPGDENNAATGNDDLVIENNHSETLTDFEKTKNKIKEYSEKFEQKLDSTSSKVKTPSRNLTSFLNNSKTVENSSVTSPIPSSSNVSSSMSPSLRKTPRKNTPITKPVTPATTGRPESIEEISIDESEITTAITAKVSSKKKPAEPSSSSSLKKRKKLEVSVSSSKVNFTDFGGNEEVLKNICKLLVHLKHPEVYLKLGVTPPRGFLLHGPPGCGKTLLAHAIAGELQLPFIKISAPEIVSGVSGDSEKKLRELFEQAVENAPCVLFIDEIDCITPKRESAGKDMERRIVAQLLTCLDELGDNTEAQVVVIGATNRADSLDPALRRAGRFDREIALGIPDVNARQKILEVLCRNLRLEAGTDLARLAHLTPGYVGADLTSLAREAAMSAVNRVFGDIFESPFTVNDQENSAAVVSDLEKFTSWIRDTEVLGESDLDRLYIEDGDWSTALKIVQPSAKREGFVTVPDVTWDDVGALENVREELQLAILAPVNHRQQFDSLGLPSSSGVLLVGPPGCGKTLVAKAIANEAGINFISVKGPELINMYVGESERAVRSVFLRAKNSRPCVIFFDEVDSLAPKRSSGSGGDGGSSSRVVNQLLTEMDGVEGREGCVWIMAATNRPDILDAAVLRPGRLDKILYVGFPEPRDRVEILRAITKNGTKPKLSPDVNIDVLGADDRCQGFSGADVGNLVRQVRYWNFILGPNLNRKKIKEKFSDYYSWPAGVVSQLVCPGLYYYFFFLQASMIALRDVLRSGQMSNSDIIIQNTHFERAFNVVKPSVSGRDRDRYEVMKKKYGVSNDDHIILNMDCIKPTEVCEVKFEASNVEISEEVEGETINTMAADVDPNRPDLRYLPGMEVRVSDKSSETSISGDTGVVVDTGDNGESVSVLCQSGTWDVNVADLEPSLPEEGDQVKSLVWEERSGVGTVVNIDDDDNAVIKFTDEARVSYQLEKLCKVDPQHA